MAYCRRCNECGVDWPSNTDYLNCPVCREKTDYRSEGRPLTTKEAERLIKQYGLEKWLEAHPDHEFHCDCGDRPEGLICWACDPVPYRPAGGRLVIRVFSKSARITHEREDGEFRVWRIEL